jgi:hypothetical protein
MRKYNKGKITAGTIQLGDGTTNKAGITGQGTGSEDVRIWAGEVFAQRLNAPFRVRQDGKMFSTAGEIAGWTIDVDALYHGTKHTTDGISPDGITLAADGSLHAERFYINADGKIGITTGGPAGKRVEIDSVNNRIDIYNASNVLLISIDDAITGTANVPGIRIYNPLDTRDKTTLFKWGLIVESDNAAKMNFQYDADAVKSVIIAKDLPLQTPIQNSNLRYLYWDSVTGQIKAGE